MAYVNVCGKQIYYEEYGAGKNPTLVYLHGGPGENCLTYTYQAQKLGEKFHVISFDQYGVFRSEAIPDEQKAGVEFHVEMIEQMRLALGIKSFIPIGHSFGGMLALIYAHTYPDCVDAIIYDCPMWSALHTSRAIAQAMQPYFEKNKMTEQEVLVNEVLSDGISPKDAFDKVMSVDLTEELSRFCHVIDMGRYNSYIDEHIKKPEVTDDCWGKCVSFRLKLFESEDFYFDYLPYLTDINKPQLLIVGEYDMTCGKYEQEWFSENVPNGVLKILAGSAHLSWFEQPETYTELISGFIKK